MTFEELQQENDALRQALEVQWEYNHFEHCSRTWPHPDDQQCHWPLPVILGGQPGYRTYPDDQDERGSR